MIAVIYYRQKGNSEWSMVKTNSPIAVDLSFNIPG